MYARILIATDGSSCSDRAVAEGARLASALGSDVLILNAMDVNPLLRDSPYDPEVTRSELRRESEAIVAGALRLATEAGVDARAELADGAPVAELVKRSDAFDLLVLGSHGKGLVRRALLGSVAQAVLQRVRCPVLVVRCADNP